MKNEMRELEKRLDGKFQHMNNNALGATLHNTPREPLEGTTSSVSMVLSVATTDRNNIPYIPPQDTMAFIAAPNQSPPALETNVFAALLSLPRLPLFPPLFPSTVRNMEIQYQRHKLEDWENDIMRGWDVELKMLYGRRKYMRQKCMDKAMSFQNGTFPQRLMRDAEALDEERSISIWLI